VSAHLLQSPESLQKQLLSTNQLYSNAQTEQQHQCTRGHGAKSCTRRDTPQRWPCWPLQLAQLHALVIRSGSDKANARTPALQCTRGASKASRASRHV